MKKSLLQLLVVIFGVAVIAGCASPMAKELSQGKANFKAGRYGDSFYQLLPLANAGNPDAQYAVGYMYFNGLGIGEDEQMAMFWMRKAAAQGQKQAAKALSEIDLAVSKAQKNRLRGTKFNMPE